MFVFFKDPEDDESNPNVDFDSNTLYFLSQIQIFMRRIYKTFEDILEVI